MQCAQDGLRGGAGAAKSGMMTGFMIALAIAFGTGISGRDRMVQAGLVTAGAPRAMLLALGVATAAVSAALMAWLGLRAAALLSAGERGLPAGIACVAAGLSLLPAVRMRAPKEPTWSLGAAALVLFACQIVDATRWTILALALTGSAEQAAWGGVAGNAAALMLGGHEFAGAFRAIREPGGVALMLAGVILATDRFW